MSKKRFLSLLSQLKRGLDLKGLEPHFDALAEAIEGHTWPEFEKKEKFPLPEELSDMDEGHYVVFSDGACRGNPGPGAWGVLAQDALGRVIFEINGIDFQTTNNRMELEGAIQGLEGLVHTFIDEKQTTPATIHVYTDSRYVVDGMTKWLDGWKQRGWRKADGKPPENGDLWQRLDFVQTNFKKVVFHWVKGHNGHPQNEYCDRLANQALDEAGL